MELQCHVFVEGRRKTLMSRCSNSSPRYSVRTTMPPLVLSPKFPTFPTYKISITLLLFSYVLERVTSIQVQKYEKSVIYLKSSRIFLIYSFILLFCLGFGIPMTSLNSCIFFLNQFTCETPSILKSNLPLSSCLMEQTECRVSKLRLNSEE